VSPQYDRENGAYRYPKQRDAIERHAARNGLQIASWFEEQQTGGQERAAYLGKDAQAAS